LDRDGGGRMPFVGLGFGLSPNVRLSLNVRISSISAVFGSHLQRPLYLYFGRLIDKEKG